jgi:hypothetical protein
MLSGIQRLKKPLKSKSLDSRFRGNDTKKRYDTVSKVRGNLKQYFSDMPRYSFELGQAFVRIA